MARMMRGSRGHPWNALSLFAFGERRTEVDASHLKEFISHIERITEYPYVSWRDCYRHLDDE
jgi:hypothetical protein